MANRSARPAPFARWLDARITDLGMTQADVARYVGTDGVQVMRWRRGDAVPQPRFLAKLAELFGLELDELQRLAYLPASSSLPATEQIDAERLRWRARYEYLLEQKVPRPLWEAYLKACDALADVFLQNDLGRLNTQSDGGLNNHASNSDEGGEKGRNDSLTAGYRHASDVYQIGTHSWAPA